jgi:cytochrome oxidase assembly protein ShyY1
MSEPTFWQVARRPRWIGALLLVLAIAALFAFLGRWQLERAIDSSRATGPDTETAVAIGDITQPGTGVASDVAWRLVTVDLTIVPGDTELLSGRVNTEDPGWWVVAHAVDSDGTSLAVAAGWAATEQAAAAAAATFDDAGALGEVTGRYLPPESPQEGDFESGARTVLATAELVNVWSDVGPIYSGYLVLDDPPAGLEAIDAPAPPRDVEVNLLNLFYALEWVVFAGAAVFMWWRLVRDAQVREVESARGGTAD